MHMAVNFVSLVLFLASFCSKKDEVENVHLSHIKWYALNFLDPDVL